MPAEKKYSFIESILFPPTWLNASRLKEKLNSKIVLITGASFGIGESLALELASSGAHLLLVARTAEKLDEVKSEVERRGGNASIFAVDLTKQDQVDELLIQLHKLPQGIDFVINNAGKSIHRSLSDSLDRHHDFIRTMSVNYAGPVQLLLSLIPMLEQTKGQIINVSAINVLLIPAPGWSAYQASKTAFDQWFRSIAPELYMMEIKTSSLYLPLVRTRMIAPTKAYDRMPAMRSSHVARKIARLMYTQNRKSAPWWLMPGQISSVLFRSIFESISISFIKRKNRSN